MTRTRFHSNPAAHRCGSAGALRAIASGLVCALLAAGAMAQEHTFDARLTTVPIDAETRARITGQGSATASLAGRTLSITGRYEGLQRPASRAGLYIGPVTGVGGQLLFDVDVEGGVSGGVRATLELGDEHVAALRSGRLYIRIDSESAPDGNLRGWLLAP